MNTDKLETSEVTYARREQLFAQASARPPAPEQRTEAAWTPAQVYAHRDRIFRTMGGA